MHHKLLHIIEEYNHGFLLSIYDQSKRPEDNQILVQISAAKLDTDESRGAANKTELLHIIHLILKDPFVWSLWCCGLDCFDAQSYFVKCQVSSDLGQLYRLTATMHVLVVFIFPI